MFCDCYCAVALPHGAVDWSVVCECGIPDHTHVLVFISEGFVDEKVANCNHW